MNKYNFLLDTVKEAGELLSVLREDKFEVAEKNGDPRDLVTSIDKDIEKYIVKQIEKHYPDHGIYGEEGSDVSTNSEYLWAIDPIDGTANFIRSIPHFAVCLGLLKNGETILGAVYNPITRELFSFEKGKGAFLNNKKIAVSSVTELRDSHVFFHAGRREDLRDWGGESYRRLLGRAKKTSNLASSSLDACFVAAGRIEASVYGTLNTLDIASALGILEEAGGIVCNESGERPKASTKSQKIYMTNNQETYKGLKELL